MSSMFIVKCQGKNITELKKALTAALNELGGEAKEFAERSVVISSESMEEVESPYAKQPPKELYNHEEEQAEEEVGNVTQLTAPASNVGASDVDAEGIPWDERIHASSKAKISNGTWRTKRGVDENLVFQVKNELRNRSAQAPTQAPPMPTSHYEAPAQPTHAMSTPAPAQPVQAAPPMPQMSQGHTLDSFRKDFAMVIGTLISQGKLTPEYVQSLAEYFKVPQIWMASPEQQEIMFNEFAKAGVIQKVG